MQSDEVEDDPSTSAGGRRSESESESGSESGSESESSSSGSSSSCFSGSAKSGGLGTSGADEDEDEDEDEDAPHRKCADPPATTAATRQRARAGESDPPRGKRRRPSALEQPQEQPPQRGLEPSAWWSARAAGPSGQGTVYEAMDPEVVDSLVGWAHALGGGGPTPLAGGMDRTGGWGGAAAAAAASGPAGPGYLASVSVAAPSRQERPPRPTLMAYLARAAGAKLAPAHERLAGAVERASRAAAVEVPGSTEWLRRQRREREAQQKRGGPTDAGRQGGALPGGAKAGASLRDRSGAATEVPRRPRSKLDVLRGMDRMFDASALVALGVAVEEVLTSALMPLAVAHVQRCRELEHRAARAIGRQGGVRDGVGDFSAANYEAGKGQARASSAAACFEAWTLPVADAVFELAKDKDARTRSGLQGPSMDSFLPSAAPEGFLQGLGSSAMAKASLEEAIARWCAAHGLDEGEVRSSVLGPLIPKCPP